MAEKSPEQIQKEKQEAQNKYLSDLKTFSYGAVSGKALAQGDENRASVSLDSLVDEMFGKDSHLVDGLLAAAHSTPEATKIAATVYSNKYQNALANLSVSNLWNFYGDLAEKYLGDLKSNAKEEIDKFKDLEFGKVQDKYFTAKEIIESKTSYFKKEQKESAEKDLEKYEKVMITIQTLGDAYLDKYNSNITDTSRKNLFKNIYGEKPSDVEAKK